MQQHLRRQSGVGNVEVELEKGKVVVQLKEDGRFDPRAMLKGIYDSGVTVFEMTVTGTGRLTKDAARGLLFEVAPNQSFAVVPNELSLGLETLAGTPAKVTLRGRLYRKPPGKQKPNVEEPLKLEILEVLKKEPAG